MQLIGMIESDDVSKERLLRRCEGIARRGMQIFHIQVDEL